VPISDVVTVGVFSDLTKNFIVDGLLKSETISPNTDKSLTTTYEYDSFGNKTKSTITGSGIVSRSTSVEYSTPFGPVKVKTLPVLASKVLVSECPRALVVLTGNLP
jgi:YD repeat-containing protein